MPIFAEKSKIIMGKESIKARKGNIADLNFDSKNFNKHTEFGMTLLEKSLRKHGAGRSIVVDKNDNIIGGNGIVETAGNIGMENTIVVETSGDELVVVKRTDVDINTREGREMAMADNATAAADLDWDIERIKEAEKDLGIDASEWGIQDMSEVSEDTDQEAQEDNYTGEVPVQPKSKLGDIYELGNHRLICGDSTKAKFLDALMEGKQADLIVMDPPYNVNYEGSDGKKIENDHMADAAFLEFLKAAFSVGNDVLKPGGAFYIWHADSEGYNFRAACIATGWKVRETLIWVKNSIVLGRQDYQWKHEPCQPAGTMVLTTEGYKAIETLTGKDRVISFDSLSGQIKGYKNGGYAIKTASRDYDGQMYTIKAGGNETRATDNHQFSVRFNANTKNKYCTYLMRRGRWWRVGIAKAYDARQFGLKTRIHQELGDEAWIISVHEDKIEAQVMEQILTCKYGIPYTVWETTAIQRKMLRSDDQVKKIYNALDIDKMQHDAEQLLKDFGRNIKYPLVSRENSWQKFSTRVTARINACNLVPGLMQLPIPGTPGIYPNFTWQEIEEVSYKLEKCRVYSLAVDKYEHYISDGIVTHNCLYGWKEGAGHYFINRRDLATVIDDIQKLDIESMSKAEMKELLQTMLSEAIPTTVINENKPLKNDVHPTMKPLKLIGRQIRNSSRQGEIVLDLFGGSGSTMMAAEQLGRKCYMVEFDPKYVDVIINRYEEMTGNMAIYVGNMLEQSISTESTK